MIKDKKILINNIYHMLSYAFQTLKQENYKDVSIEPFDEMYDLFAAILSKGISFQLKHGLYKEYINYQEDLAVVSGKINISETIKKYSSHKKVLSCNFDKFSENNMLFFSDVDLLNPTSIRWSAIQFQRNNQTYRMLIGICQLIIEGMLITTSVGDYKLVSFIDEQRMCKLYEKFILEYYRKHFPQLTVTASQIPWCVDDSTMLPTMQSDIHLQKDNTVLIIDAKYYSQTTQFRYNKHTIHSNNLYQIFTYVKNRDYQFEDLEHKVSGMLLYAKTEDDIQPNNVYQMHGNQITIKTLDLSLPFVDIKKQLDEIVKEYFSL